MDDILGLCGYPVFLQPLTSLLEQVLFLGLQVADFHNSSVHISHYCGDVGAILKLAIGNPLANWFLHL